MAVQRFHLTGGEDAVLSVKAVATTLAVEEERVSTWDLEGRPLVLVRDGRTWKRALDGRFLRKERDRSGHPLRALLPPDEGRPVVEAARREAAEALRVVDDATAAGRLRRIVAGTPDALEEDARRFREVYRPVGILPPDRYLAVVLQATEGCSWNRCTFCDLYRDTPFRVKTPEEFRDHIARVRRFFGRGLALRRSVFLGDANALCAGADHVLPLVEAAAQAFPPAPEGTAGTALRRWLQENPRGSTGLYSFVDVWTGHRKSGPFLERLRRLGLRRVYVGLETGDPELLRFLNKPGTPEEARELVELLHEAGIAAGVIVMLGVGGERFFHAHARRTGELLAAMGLRAGDLLYFSEFVAHSGLEYVRRTESEPDLRPLSARRCREQRGMMEGAVPRIRTPSGPRAAVYDIREFIY